MNADQSSPAAPTSVPSALTPAGPSLPVVPHPHHHLHHPPKDDQSPVLVWLLSTWEKLKAGQIGSPKWLALAVGIGLVAFGWWYFARSSKKADSALWYQYDTSLSTDDLKKFAELPVNADTDAARLARRNLARAKMADGLRVLNEPASRKADKLKAVKAIEEARDELVKLADEFKRDKTSKAGCYLDAAEAEKALVGVPKENATESAVLNAKANGRGQVERVAELTRKAAEAIGDKTDAGQKLLAEADRLTKEAEDIYKVGGYLHAAFNEADPEERKPILPPLGGDTPPPPAGGTTDGPKAPDKIPDPVNPVKTPDAKPEDKPKEPAPLPPANPAEKK